jgi:broad specificity phosphatase PhoE
MGELFLLRHGETEWSKSGRHTGLTDLPLTSYGEQQARSAGAVLEHLRPGGRFALVLVSPLQRARRTAELAGLSDRTSAAVEVDEDLVEWDYGAYEGLTTPEIRDQGHPGWLIFTDGVPAGATPGESLEEVAQRGRRVLARARPALEDGDVALVGHGHALRILACDWLGRSPDLGQQLLLGAGSVSVLGEEHDVPAIRHWSVSVPDGRG